MKIAFDYFDEVFYSIPLKIMQDHSGTISVDEIKQVFSNVADEKLLKIIVQEADTNHDGEVYIKYIKIDFF